MRRKTGSLGTSFIWKANRIKDLPTVVLHRHRRDPINDHPQRYHVNLGKQYVKGNVNPRSSEIHFKKRNKEVVIKGVDKPKENKTVYLTNGKDVAVVKSMSSDGKKLKVHIIGKEGYEYVNPKDWKILKVTSGNFSNRCDPKLTNYVNRVARDIEKEKGMKKFPKKICAYYDYDPTSHASWYATEYKSNGKYVPEALEIRLDPRFSAGDLTKFRREATEHELREMNCAVLSDKPVDEAHKLAKRREEPVYGKRIGDWDDIESLIDERLGGVH